MTTGGKIAIAFGGLALIGIVYYMMQKSVAAPPVVTAPVLPAAGTIPVTTSPTQPLCIKGICTNFSSKNTGAGVNIFGLGCAAATGSHQPVQVPACSVHNSVRR